MAWVNTPASDSLRREFDAAFPERSLVQDGTIGNGEHSVSPSDHNPDETGIVESEHDSDSINEVHARDVSTKLNRAGWSMEKVIQIILARCRAGAERRLRYIIFNERIWSDSDGWVQRYYGNWSTGRDPHDQHAHFSFHYGSGSGTGNPENITSAWGFLAAVNSEDDMDPADLGEPIAQKYLTKAIRDARAQLQALELKRIADRGWGGTKGMSERQLQEYVFEQVVGPANIDADGDGVANESASLQGRLKRLEEGMAKVLEYVAAQQQPEPTPVTPPATPATAAKKSQ